MKDTENPQLLTGPIIVLKLQPERKSPFYFFLTNFTLSPVLCRNVVCIKKECFPPLHSAISAQPRAGRKLDIGVLSLFELSLLLERSLED